jgi:lipopolysaccharide biosynthesis glycosyltransferase
MKIYMGYDKREIANYAIACTSIVKHSSIEGEVIPLDRFDPIMLERPVSTEHGQLWCPISNAPMSTDFSIARFAVPLLCDDEWAIFVDCDVLFVADIAELIALRDERYAVQVVKHNHVPRGDEVVKMDGQLQTAYPRKNWSSLILWNLKHPANKRLDRIALLTWPGRDLHAFKWLSDDEIGELPLAWNFLVGVSNRGSLEGEAKMLHFTLGGPLLGSFVDPDADQLWLEAQNEYKLQKVS